jgi:hypothetical protein
MNVGWLYTLREAILNTGLPILRELPHMELGYTNRVADSLLHRSIRKSIPWPHIFAPKHKKDDEN